MLVGFCDGEPGQRFDHAVVTANFWSVEALRSLLAEAGFDVVEQHRRQDAGRRPHAALIARPTRGSHPSASSCDGSGPVVGADPPHR
jgi:hypothetical protein